MVNLPYNLIRVRIGAPISYGYSVSQSDSRYARNPYNPKYSKVANLEFLMFPREEHMSGQSAKIIRLCDAVSKGIVNNETLGYFIGRVYLFLSRLGIDKDLLGFRQHLANEMAPYACDCWDAEIEGFGFSPRRSRPLPLLYPKHCRFGLKRGGWVPFFIKKKKYVTP